MSRINVYINETLSIELKKKIGYGYYIIYIYIYICVCVCKPFTHILEKKKNSTLNIKRNIIQWKRLKENNRLGESSK